MTRVLIASASPVGRKGLEALVEAANTLELAGSSIGPGALARDVAGFQPDVVVLQTALSFRELAAELAEIGGDGAASRGPAMVVLAEGPHASDFARAFRSGIAALLPLEATAAEIVAAIEAAAAGLFVLHPAFVDAVSEIQSGPGPPPTNMPAPLSPREIEVLNLMALGLGNKEIAARLGISEHTVKFHIGSIFNKLDASGRTEAVTLGIRAGLILL